jgi:hypothetical protein
MLPYDPLTRDIWVCRVCRRPLDLRQFDEPDTGIIVDYQWEHTAQDRVNEDHKPDPVRLKDSGGEIVGRCDFCNEPGPIWNYPCEDFDMAHNGQHAGFIGDWAACNRCHLNITKNEWGRIAERNAKASPGLGRNQVKRWVTALHAEFRKHRTGNAVLTWGKVGEQ